MMDGNGSFLCIYTGTQHAGRTEQHTDFPLIHTAYKLLALLIIFSFLYKTDFMCRYAVIIYKFALDFPIDVPFSRLVST
ncbi:hypothetical protein D3C72_1731030 [compost metagenome]